MADIDIHRPAYDQATFDIKYGKKDAEVLSIPEQVNRCCKKKCRVSKGCLLDKIFSVFPFIVLLKEYQWKKWIIKDLVAGICVGAVHIPQSMGFSILTSLPPVYGLYSTFFPVLIYFFLGTSHHISMGTMAVISIMIGSVVDRETDLYVASLGQVNITAMSENGTELITEEELLKFKLGIAVSISFMIGIFQLGISLLRMSIFATFMSSSFVGGFMTGAACHIITSQAPFGLGFMVPRQAGLFRVPKSWYLIFASITETNPGDIVTFILCSAFLITCKIINDKFQKKMLIPIPGELILIIIATLISYLANFHVRFDMRILKYIPTGIPFPEVPSFYNVPAYAVDSLIIALVSYSICVSFAKTFSQKYRYKIDQHQELFALGAMHTIGSFFHCFAGAQAPPRTLIHENTGGKSQIASLFSAALVLLVCLLLAPWFEPLPNSVLSSIIIIALLPLFKVFVTMPHMWRVNKYDCIIWQVTFLSVVFLNVDYGLFIGIGVSMLTLVADTYLARGQLLLRVDTTELFESKKTYTQLQTPVNTHNVFVFKFNSPLYFANVESFKEQLFKVTVNPLSFKKKIKNKETNIKNESNSKLEELNVNLEEFTQTLPDKNGMKINEHLNKAMSRSNGTLTNGNLNGTSISHTSGVLTNGNTSNIIHTNGSPTNGHDNYVNGDSFKITQNDVFTDDETITAVILDCSALCYIDITGLNALKSIQSLYKDVDLDLILVNCPESLLYKMNLQGINFNGNTYPSIQDAFTMITTKQLITSM